MKQRTTIYLDEKDRQAIATIREIDGITSDSDVIRSTLRRYARRLEALEKGEQRKEADALMPFEEKEERRCD